MGSRGEGLWTPGHLKGDAVECRLTWLSRNACQRTNLTDGWKLLEQGPFSQAASQLCSGGVSAVMGTSDFDEYIVGAVEHIRQSVLRRIASGAVAADVGNGVPGDSLWIHW